jgi:pyruvate/2-oxoglutarate dehydrogenase complex dihydrolipoamide acyltransferase (E2) component
LQDDGYVAKILVAEGQKDISVGTPVLVIVEDESAVEKFRDYQPLAGGESAPAADAGPPSEPKKAKPATDSPGGSFSFECKGHVHVSRVQALHMLSSLCTVKL